MRARDVAAPLVPAILTLLAAGCGAHVDSNVGVAGTLPAPSGSLEIALPGRPGSLDPLAARTPAEVLVVAQINEPLAGRLSGPYDELRRVSGIATRIRPAAGDSVWRLRLRPGIRFQDGSRLDAAAVLANATRWRTTAAGQQLLPGLVAADSPRPGLVRFFLSRPDADFAKRLAAPQLGLVSQRALAPSSGDGATMVRNTDTGTGPFELRQRSSRNVVMARNAAWWGTDLRLGPAIDFLTLTYARGSAARARLLRDGAAQVAEGLNPGDAARLGRDPLLEVQNAGAGDESRGVSRSVRGIGGEVPSLQSAWMTTIG
jgi:peptide/nickel transport system substrate-binding protein